MHSVQTRPVATETQECFRAWGSPRRDALFGSFDIRACLVRPRLP